jgi:cytochrome c553
MKTMNALAVAAVAAMALSAGSAWARGDAAAGAKKAAEVCAACHGEAGAKPATPDYPILAGQPQDYLEHTLKAYKSGKRKNAIMAGMATPLSKQEIIDLAAYFSQQKGVQHKY